MVKIFVEDLYWKEKLLIFTWHFKKEFEVFHKYIEFVLTLLDEGEHKLVAKKQNKYNVLYGYKRELLCLSYVSKKIQ